MLKTSVPLESSLCRVVAASSYLVLGKLSDCMLY